MAVLAEAQMEKENGEGDIEFSIVVPVYNVEKYVAACLDSILEQDCASFEIVIVDDGSTDSSGSICDDYQTCYPSIITVIHKCNEGLLLARTDGYAATRGNYLLTVDSDDMLIHGALSVIDSAVKETGADVIKYGFTRDYKKVEKWAKTEQRFAGAECYDRPEKRSLLRLLCEGTSQNSMCAKAVKRGCANVGVDFSRYAGMTYAEDFLQTLEIYDSAESFCEINMPLYFYRPNPESTTSGEYKPEHYYSCIASFDEAAQYAVGWEQEYGCDGLLRGLAQQGLLQASKYAIYLALNDDVQGLLDLAESEAFRSRYVVEGAIDGLRFDQKNEVRLLSHGLWPLLKAEAVAKRCFNKLRGR